jgi:uncharacterized protein YndB with AHSA1/START domain
MSNVFKIERLFKAPRQLVWDTLTQPEHLLQWGGPKGCTMSHCEIDFRDGGTYHYCLQTPDGQLMWGLQQFKTIQAPAKITLIQCFSDANRGATRHPMAPKWPLYTLSTTTLTEQGGNTLMQLEWSPHEASAEEIALFNASHAGMNQGWSGSFEKLENYLALLQTKDLGR